MKKRSPLAVFLLPFVTFGIYGIYWEVSTKSEMKNLGADIPTAWLLIVPIANIWWLWKYAQGVEKVTAGKMNGALAFVLLWFLGPIAAAIIQASFNEVTGPVAASSPAAPLAPVLPVEATAPEAPAPPAEPTPPTPPTSPIS